MSASGTNLTANYFLNPLQSISNDNNSLVQFKYTLMRLYPEALAASIARIALSRLPRQKRFEVIGICLHPILCIL